MKIKIEGVIYMMKIINFFKNDFIRVKTEMKSWNNGKTPTWVIVVWYFILAPIGLLLYPFIKIFTMIMMWKLKRLMDSKKA